MRFHLFGTVLLGLLSQQALAFDWDINSVRVTLSKPQTFHSLIYAPTPETKINFELEPINNERIGLFINFKGIEIGYAVDFIDDNEQTETEDFIFSYKKFKKSRITFNYQTLEGLKTNALNVLNEPQEESVFVEGSKSTKFELFGIHDTYTFFGETLFDHFFLNHPKLSQSKSLGLSLIASWSYKNLTLESQDNLLFSPDYLNGEVEVVKDIRAESLDFALGPLLSMGFGNNIHGFAEAKIGKGYFRNKDENTQLKRSGNEEIYSVGAGASWTTSNKKTLVVSRAWLTRGRHIETFFGDISVIHYF